MYCIDFVVYPPEVVQFYQILNFGEKSGRATVRAFKPGVGQYIAIYATLTAREFFLAYFYPSSPFTCIFSKTSPNFFLCWPAE